MATDVKGKSDDKVSLDHVPKSDLVIVPKSDLMIVPKSDSAIVPKSDSAIVPKSDSAIVPKSDSSRVILPTTLTGLTPEMAALTPEMAAAFMEWYAVQNGLTRFDQHLMTWKTHRDRLVAEFKSNSPRISFFRPPSSGAWDWSQVKMTLVWPLSWLSIPGTHLSFRLGVGEEYRTGVDSDGFVHPHSRVIQHTYWYYNFTTKSEYNGLGTDRLTVLSKQPLWIRLEIVMGDPEDSPNKLLSAIWEIEKWGAPVVLTDLL